MSGGMYRQDADGAYRPAEPMGWLPGIDWEVNTSARPMTAEAFEGPDLLVKVTARWRWLLRMRVLVAHRQLLRVTGATP